MRRARPPALSWLESAGTASLSSRLAGASFFFRCRGHLMRHFFCSTFNLFSRYFNCRAVALTHRVRIGNSGTPDPVSRPWSSNTTQGAKTMPASSKFHRSIQVPLSSRQPEAIGMVVVQWSMVENWMDFQMSAFLAEDIEALAEFRKGSFRVRHRHWRDVIDSRVHEPWKQELLAIGSRIGGIKQDRDRVVHGQWGEEPNKGPDPVWLFS